MTGRIHRHHHIIAHAVGLLLVMATFLSGSQAALADVKAGPVQGNQANGWYVDTFTIPISGTCQGDFNFTPSFDSHLQLEGSHNYLFSADNSNNLYLTLDPSDPNNPFSGSITKLTQCSAVATQPPQQIAYYSPIKLDAQPPGVQISSPANGSSTTSQTININGNASDSASGIANVTLSVNGGSSTNIGQNFNQPVSLNIGQNSLSVTAVDKVGHSTTSTITVFRQSSGGGGGSGGSTGGTGGTSGGGSSGTNSPSSSTPATSSSNQSAGTSNNNISSAQSSQLVQSFTPSIPGGTPEQQLTDNVAAPANRWLAALIILLLSGIVLLIAFAPPRKLRPRGLRPKILISVIVPSLVPILALGTFGYIELTDTVKSSLSLQLAKAAQTTSLRLERDFDNRRTVLINTGAQIINLKNQYTGQLATLASQRDACNAAVNKSPEGAISNPNCQPFLAEFATSAGQAANKSTYLADVQAGYNSQQSSITAEENSRIKGYLDTLELYYPEILETAVLNNAASPQIVAGQTSTGNTALALLPQYQKQFPTLLTSDLNLVTSQRSLVMSYPVDSSDGKPQGAILVAYNLDNTNFIKPTWDTTPKAHAQDLVIIIDPSGNVIYPGVPVPASLTAQFKQLYNANKDSFGDLSIGKQKLFARLTPVTNMGWATVVASPSNLILQPLVGLQRAAIAAIILSALLSALVAFFFVGRITKFISRLVSGARVFAERKFDYQIDVKSGDELETLADTLNSMAVSIQAAEKALDEKNKEFINVATHELKAPMTAIIGNLSMIADDGIGQVDEEAKRLIGEAYSGTIRLRNLVSEMLDIARLESGKAEFVIQPLDMNKEADEIIKMQLITAKEKGITVNFKPVAGLPKVAADQTKLQIIITNFISNAIKYNKPKGSVTLSLEDNGGFIVVTIADTGLGIPADQQSKMFQKFFRVAGEDRRNVPGTGLGMYITKQFIEAMGGKLWFESRAGQGTSFHFTLPVATDAAPAPVSAPSATNTTLPPTPQTSLPSGSPSSPTPASQSPIPSNVVAKPPAS